MKEWQGEWSPLWGQGAKEVKKKDPTVRPQSLDIIIFSTWLCHQLDNQTDFCFKI